MAALIERYAKPFGWVNGIWRRRSRKRFIPIKFMRPDGELVPFDDFEKRVKSAIQALHAVQQGALELYRQGVKTEAFLVASVVPVERAHKAKVPPLRFAILLPPSIMNVINNEGKKIVNVEAAKGISVPLVYYTEKDLEHVNLLRGKGHLLHNSIHESLSALYVHRELYPETIARGVYITIAPMKKEKVSRMLGKEETEFDHLLLDKHGTVHIVEHKTAPHNPNLLEEGKWEEIITHKVRAYELPVLYIKKLVGNVRVHFVVTGNNEDITQAYAQETHRVVKKLWDEFAKKIPVEVHGVHASTLRPVFRERV